jgi:hypothetical protein
LYDFQNHKKVRHQLQANDLKHFTGRGQGCNLGSTRQEGSVNKRRDCGAGARVQHLPSVRRDDEQVQGLRVFFAI